MTAVSSYDFMKNNPKTLLALRGKYVKLQLIQNRSINGFVNAIDPEGHSIILLEPCGEYYQTILVPGHAILDVLTIDSIPDITLQKLTLEKSVNDLVEKKRKLILWFEQNHLCVSESGDNIVLRTVSILPPYDVSCIYSKNWIVTQQVRDIMEKMPANFEG